MSDVWPDVHQMCNALATLSLSIPLKEFAHLEEKHHEDGLGELRLCPRQESDAQSADGSNRHEEMLVEGIALHNALPGLT